MGYRSDVAIAIYAPEPEMTAFIAAQRLKQATWVKDKYHINKYITTCLDAKDNKYDETWVVLFAEFDAVKWYPNYDDVACWEKCVADAKDLNLNTEFVRVGEDYEDVETDFHGDMCEYHLGVHRTIYQDLPTFIEE